MAEQNQHNANDHHATYEAFMSMTKTGIGFVVVVLILLAIFLVH